VKQLNEESLPRSIFNCEMPKEKNTKSIFFIHKNLMYVCLFFLKKKISDRPHSKYKNRRKHKHTLKIFWNYHGLVSKLYIQQFPLGPKQTK
jgi:hypothetical protein